MVNIVPPMDALKASKPREDESVISVKCQGIRECVLTNLKTTHLILLENRKISGASLDFIEDLIKVFFSFFTQDEGWFYH